MDFPTPWKRPCDFLLWKEAPMTVPKEKTWLSLKLYSEQWNWTGRMWIIAYASLIYWLLRFAHFKVQTSFAALWANLPSVPLASILLLKARDCNCTAPHCLSVYFPKCNREYVYWLQTLLLHFVLGAHATHKQVKVAPMLSSIPSISGAKTSSHAICFQTPLPLLYTW